MFSLPSDITRQRSVNYHFFLAFYVFIHDIRIFWWNEHEQGKLISVFQCTYFGLIIRMLRFMFMCQFLASQLECVTNFVRVFDLKMKLKAKHTTFVFYCRRNIPSFLRSFLFAKIISWLFYQKYIVLWYVYVINHEQLLVFGSPAKLLHKSWLNNDNNNNI